MLDSKVDVAILGGGGVGSSTAYFLTKLAPNLRVVVIERDPTYARASTALSAGGIRQQFSTPENIALSRASFDFMLAAERELEVDGQTPGVNLSERPYLRLVNDEGRDRLRELYELQRQNGAELDWLETGDVARRFDWLNVDDVAAGVVGVANEGTFDPYSLLSGFRRKAIAQGAIYVHDEVLSVTRDPSGDAIVFLASGEQITAERIVNSCGARAGEVARTSDIELSIVPLKAHTFAFSSQVEISNCPVVIDQIQSLQFRPEGEDFICGMPEDLAEDAADVEDFAINYDAFNERIWPALSHRTSRFDAIKFRSAWVGLIEWHMLDGNPVIGPHPAWPNYFFAAGFSGHGAQQTPAAGRALAELISTGSYGSIDLSRFGYQRVLDNAPVVENA